MALSSYATSVVRNHSQMSATEGFTGAICVCAIVVYVTAVLGKETSIHLTTEAKGTEHMEFLCVKDTKRVMGASMKGGTSTAKRVVLIEVENLEN